MIPSWTLDRNAFQILALFVSMIITVGIIYVDVLLLKTTMGEHSLVQIAQALMILGSAIFFFVGARNHADHRGYLLLVSTLFLCMFIRENDGFLDNIVHGFWLVLVLLVGAVGAFAILKNAKTLRGPLRRHAQDGTFWILAVGFFQLIVFSRLFGSGLLWNHILSSEALGTAKTIVQESTELVSYSFIFLGAYLSHKYLFSKNQNLAAEKAYDEKLTSSLSDQTT